ncbi:hypothetical protein DL93DRAFT_2209061 [Clavulina sp. PMI_390]|nr:hypothetical protein DL93DRAFT_2209061 [Clavulina sp. PMI_390]
MKAFILQAHLLDVCGDMPAVAKLTRMKGPVAKKPCRRCNIIGIRVPGSRSTAHYCPLHRSNHPDSRLAGSIAVYAANSLPTRTHDSTVEQARAVDAAPSNAESLQLATEYGINGESSLCRLSSFKHPASDPHDLMHLVWENLIKNLVAMWQGSWKSLDHSAYAISQREWEKIGKLVGSSRKLIPGCFGAALPDFVARPSEMTAEKWSFFTLFIAPIVLHDAFPHRRYYDHFMRLVPILHLLISFEITTEQIGEVERGLRQWVEDYER